MDDRVRDFGLYLKELRLMAGMSLRDAEKTTHKDVSNAYISQLESGKAARPSPHILDKLATAYGVKYEDLMQRAGYIKASAESKDQKSGIAFLSKQKLSLEERKALVSYLEFIRSKRSK